MTASVLVFAPVWITGYRKRKDKHAARRFFRKMLKHHGHSPRLLVTNNLKSFGAGKKDVMPGVMHCQDLSLQNK